MKKIMTMAFAAFVAAVSLAEVSGMYLNTSCVRVFDRAGKVVGLVAASTANNSAFRVDVVRNLATPSGDILPQTNTLVTTVGTDGTNIVLSAPIHYLAGDMVVWGGVAVTNGTTAVRLITEW